MTDMRAASACRSPRALVHDIEALRGMLEAAEPPLGLLESEMALISGQYAPGLPGVVTHAREEYMVYRREDGRALLYVYEGALAYALAAIDATPEPKTITTLRARLLRAEAEGRRGSQTCATLLGASWDNLGGVRPKVLEHRPDGSKVYILTVTQVRKFLASWDAGTLTGMAA